MTVGFPSIDDVIFLHGDSTKDDALKAVENTPFSSRLLHWKEFVGCESPVIVSFVSKEEEPWQVLTIISRTQNQVEKN